MTPTGTNYFAFMALIGLQVFCSKILESHWQIQMVSCNALVPRHNQRLQRTEIRNPFLLW
jgi:hypothetical protein